LDYATDASGDIAGVEDFPGTLTGANHYLYDANGNLRRDDYRALNLYYNSFNLPWELDFGNNKKVIYIYDGAGQKIAKEVSDGINPAVHTDYLGQFVHEYTLGGTSSLKYIITSEGRLKNKGTNAASVWEWEYNLTDHLGNVRVVFRPGTSNTAEVMEYNNYFPFGMKMTPYLCQTTTDNKYLYNGKELQTDFGLNWYDYGARFYDPSLGRWYSVDPLAEKYRRWSPYNYGVDNPMRFIDPDGMSASDFKDKDDNLIIHVDDGSNAVYKLDGTDHTNESFKFDGYNNQGGKDEVSVEGAVAGAQDYVTNNYDKCNQSVNFVGRTYESATEAQGKTVDNIRIVNGNSLAQGITKDLASKVTAEKSVASAQESAGKGNLVVGANGGHVVTMTTKTFDVTRYNTSGSIIGNKQIIGGKTTNVNGSARPTNIGPGKLNSFQNPNYSGMIWYSFPAK
ncbi:MAG: RHS repeat-associated core domain-containing protein, partial [Bacteroidota bacterium]|nr:RHS repeat-associated core domain-containing protein [Bacteroidota bacterium]